MAAGSWVIVTGAAGYLGSAIGRHYSVSGRNVLLLDRAEINAGDAGPSGSVNFRKVDLAESAAVNATLNEALPNQEPICLLINAAGLIWNEPVIALKNRALSVHQADTFDSAVRANLTTTFVVSGHIAARMARTGGGAIVNFSSVAARGSAGQAAYSAAKAGIEGLTRAMAQELGPLGIRVNAIAPGFIDVPTTRSAVPETVLANYIKRTPLNRLGTVEDIILGIESLERNTFINGIVLHIDGGLRL